MAPTNLLRLHLLHQFLQLGVAALRRLQHRVLLLPRPGKFIARARVHLSIARLCADAPVPPVGCLSRRAAGRLYPVLLARYGLGQRASPRASRPALHRHLSRHVDSSHRGAQGR